jgi:hypothetical protein
MQKRFWLIPLYAVLHLAVTASCVMYAFGSAMARFDDPSASKRLLESIAGAAASALMLPGSLLWTKWASTHLSNLVEWALLAANSALWGAVVFWVTTALANGGLQRRRQVHRDPPV